MAEGWFASSLGDAVYKKSFPQQEKLVIKTGSDSVQES